LLIFSSFFSYFFKKNLKNRVEKVEKSVEKEVDSLSKDGGFDGDDHEVERLRFAGDMEDFFVFFR